MSSGSLKRICKELNQVRIEPIIHPGGENDRLFGYCIIRDNFTKFYDMIYKSDIFENLIYIFGVTKGERG